MTERWLNVEEIAQHLGVAAITVYRWLEKGSIPSHRVGKLWRFKASEVDEWIGIGGAGSDSSNKLSNLKSTKNLHQEK
ncbi:MAG: helix-turn-helix domain-containing protein [Bdellovibrio sp.]|nr:helix-turn-helix domain-containing protein [Bdellovibrio sp.]